MSLKSLFNLVKPHLQTTALLEQLHSVETVRLHKYAGSSLSFLIKDLHERKVPIWIITPDEDTARAIESDLVELGNEDVLYFPATSEKPYDKEVVSDPSLLVQRSDVLQQITHRKSALMVTSAKAVFEKISSPINFKKSTIHVSKEQTIDPDELRERLVNQGYTVVAFVDSPGEMAFRGGIVDVFPYTGTYPVRLEFFGDQIDSIREFDPGTQRSVSFLNEARLVPNVSSLSSDQKSAVLSYASPDTHLVCVAPDLIEKNIQEYWDHAEFAFGQVRDSTALPPSIHYLSFGEFNQFTSKHKQIVTGSLHQDADTPVIALNASPQPDFNASIKLLNSDIKERAANGFDTWILCDNDGQKDRFEELLDAEDSSKRITLVIHSLHEGFILPEAKLAVFTDHQIFNRYHRPKARQKKVRGGFSAKEIRDLRPGDFVVHVDFGIGQFQGFKQIVVKNIPQEAVVVKYAEDSILYVNVSSLHKLQKYSGKDGTVPKITKLGSGEWARKKAKTKSQIKDIARDLIKMYAKRKANKAHAFAPDSGMQMELEASFEFEETPDQKVAIDDVKRDMESERPMDRLVCGDVGFGKTEVAIRAAFKAVNDGKQVAVLVPTTILADQHWKTFKKRMRDFPVNVEMVNRFRSAAEIKEVIKKTAQGKVDILVGTHRITSSDVKFKDLGLLVIDEEQRFGVATKEKIKSLKATVDVLTLSATPIPRTLQFSLMGARDLSVIQTPPPNRQPVYTEIHGFDSIMIRDAILQEVSRNGQVYFINNRVHNIEEVSEMIRKLVPNIRVRFAHGQMKGTELEKIIVDFYAHKFDVLVSTNIVENGIDISNANTIIINRADLFGLSELHQLRGRVGRSNRKAFCHLITPPLNDLTLEARRRLMALVEFSDLGSGLNIAMRDLDIRGAGDLLGGEQSGFINDIGIELYTKILNDAVKELKQTEFADLFENEVNELEFPETSVDFDVTAILDKYYVSDDIERLNLYRTLGKATSIEQIHEWIQEVTDRFGPLTNHAKNLIAATRIKLAASKLYMDKVLIRNGKAWLTCPEPKSDRGQIFFENGFFQQLLSRLETLLGQHGYKVTQKDGIVRIVLESVNDLEEAYTLLEKINLMQPVTDNV
jgi:transcription-repair coupling factor (superfamily II helicase)